MVMSLRNGDLKAAKLFLPFSCSVVLFLFKLSCYPCRRPWDGWESPRAYTAWFLSMLFTDCRLPLYFSGIFMSESRMNWSKRLKSTGRDFFGFFGKLFYRF